MAETYWLHIVESKSHAGASTYMLSLAPAPLRNAEGGALPTVHHPTWEQLATLLSRVGVNAAELSKGKKELADEGSYTIAEVSLTPSQIALLGFVVPL